MIKDKLVNLLKLTDITKTNNSIKANLKDDNEFAIIYSRLENNGFEEDENQSVIDTNQIVTVFQDDDTIVTIKGNLETGTYTLYIKDL